MAGAATYIGDLSPVGMLHAYFVRSQYAHARLLNIDTSAASAMRGVVAVLAAPTSMTDRPLAPHQEGRAIRDGPCSPKAVASWAGHRRRRRRVEEIARDAADNVAVTYDGLPRARSGFRDGSRRAVVHESLGSNICFEQHILHGDVEAAFKRAGDVVERRIVNQRVAALPMNARPLAEYRRGEVAWSYTGDAVPACCNQIASWDCARIWCG